MSLLDIALKYRAFDLSGFVPVHVDDQPIGWTKPDLAKALADHKTWQFDGNALRLDPTIADFTARSNAIHQTFLDLSAKSILPPLPKYPYDDWVSIDDSKSARVHRFYMWYLGITSHCVMVNGYESDTMWVAKRNQLMEEGPGMLDLMIAGMMTIDQSIEDALYHEGHEECGLEKNHIPLLTFSHKTHLVYPSHDGYLKREIFYIHDFDTQGIFKPKVVRPDEVEDFQAVPIQELLDRIRNGAPGIKHQVAFVMIDFMLRHSYITKMDKDHAELLYHLTTPHELS